MKKQMMSLGIAILFGIAFFGQALAGEMDHSGHKKKAASHKMEHSDHQMDHSGHMGKMIHETNVDGFAFAYHLIDMKERMKGMKDMGQMKDMNMTHHLMVYIKSPNGHSLEKAKIGYLVLNPDGSKNKAMTMHMNGGHGADVNFHQKGRYTIKTKAVVDGKKLVDTFEYIVN